MAEALTPKAPIAALSPLGDEAQLRVDVRTVRLAAIRLLGGQAIDLPAPWPDAGRVSGDDAFALVSAGPRAALAVAPATEAPWPPLSSAAAIADQSGGYAVLRISGGAAQRVMARLLAIDMHPDAFGPHAAAVTTCCRIGVTLWRPSAALGYDMAIPRSYARTFAERFGEAARAAFKIA